jgi:hypothetical protein
MLLALGAAAGRSVAQTCPAQDIDTLMQRLAEASSCQTAFVLFQACSFGTGGDVALGAAVVERCEADFIKRLSASERRAYARQRRRCAGKYRNQLGTQYRSFEAFCEADVARRYAERFSGRRSNDDSRPSSSDSASGDAPISPPNRLLQPR